MASPSDSRPLSPTPSQLPPIPNSPIYSIASTANPISALNLPLPPPPRPAHAVLTKNDLARSQEAYADLLSSAKQYRLALASLSTAASAFGSALEACARLKEARADAIGAMGPPAGPNSLSGSFMAPGRVADSTTGDALLAASGVHQLVANHQQILSETVYRSFEVPLLHDLDKWQGVIDDEEEVYKQKIKAQTKEIKRLEKEGLKLHKQRRRDVARFRAHLVGLTEKLDGLTETHSEHSRALLRESQETSGRIVEASCSLVRAEVDIFESLARKGWSGGGLDDLLERGQDLFATEGQQHTGQHGHHGGATGLGHSSGETAKLFSILPPKSILADSADEATRTTGTGGAHKRSDSLMDTDRYQSLAAVASDVRPDMDNESVFSADFNRPRGARPFSPQPIRRAHAGVSIDELGGFLNGWEEDDSRDEDDDNDNEDAKEEVGKGGETHVDGRESPEFITDESSPDGGSPGGTDGRN